MYKVRKYLNIQNLLILILLITTVLFAYKYFNTQITRDGLKSNKQIEDNPAKLKKENFQANKYTILEGNFGKNAYDGYRIYLQDGKSISFIDSGICQGFGTCQRYSLMKIIEFGLDDNIASYALFYLAHGEGGDCFVLNLEDGKVSAIGCLNMLFKKEEDENYLYAGFVESNDMEGLSFDFYKIGKYSVEKIFSPDICEGKYCNINFYPAKSDLSQYWIVIDFMRDNIVCRNIILKDGKIELEDKKYLYDKKNKKCLKY